MRRIALWCGLVWLGLSPLALAAESLPLPNDVKRLSPSLQLMIGEQPVTIQTFRTQMSVEELRDFYSEALPKADWKVEPLPWMAHAAQNLVLFDSLKETIADSVEKAKRDHPEEAKQIDEAFEKPELQALLDPDRLQQLRQQTKRLLHAVKNDEHLLLNMTPAEGGTGVFVNRWRGELYKPPQPGEQPAGQADGSVSWSQQNVCCSPESVPAAERKLPFSIPDYPGARMVVSGSPTTGPIVSALYLSADPMDDVLTFYRDHMAYNGWKLTKDSQQQVAVPPSAAPRPITPSSVTASQLSFTSSEGMCGVTVAESPGTAQGNATGSSREHTTIIVNYINGELVRGATKHERPKRSR